MKLLTELTTFTIEQLDFALAHKIPSTTTKRRLNDRKQELLKLLETEKLRGENKELQDQNKGLQEELDKKKCK